LCFRPAQIGERLSSAVLGFVVKVKGLGQLYWDIEVVLGFDGNIERVLMIYKPPAPF
jgi:hypothetical protein